MGVLLWLRGGGYEGCHHHKERIWNIVTRRTVLSVHHLFSHAEIKSTCSALAERRKLPAISILFPEPFRPLFKIKYIRDIRTDVLCC